VFDSLIAIRRERELTGRTDAQCIRDIADNLSFKDKLDQTAAT